MELQLLLLQCLIMLLLQLFPSSIFYFQLIGILLLFGLDESIHLSTFLSHVIFFFLQLNRFLFKFNQYFLLQLREFLSHLTPLFFNIFLHLYIQITNLLLQHLDGLLELLYLIVPFVYLTSLAF